VAGGSDPAPRPRPGGDEPRIAARNGGEAGGVELREILRPVDTRTAALAGLFVLAAFYTLYFARPFFLPLVLALLLNLLLSPLVAAMGRLRVPQSLAAGLVVLALLGGVAGSAYLLVEPAGEWMDRAPTSLARVESKLRRLMEPVERVNRATQEVEKLTEVDGGGRPRQQQVQVEEESLSGALLRRTTEATAGLAVVLVLLYFLLASGDLFLRKLIRVLPTLEDKKRAVDIARQLQRDLSRYLATVTLINLGLGVAVGVAMYLLGLPNPMLWGVMATVLNFVPYLGAIVGILVIGLVSALTFDGVGPILLPPLVYFLLTATEGYFVTPLILGRRLTLNPVMILLSLLLWGWLWGIAGAVLAVPMLAVIKILCDHIEPLHPLGEFLGD
jgi:predicted PurR-regulated permease PerM